MNKIRVLHVFEPYFGGVPKYVELLLKYNNNSKIKNYVVCSTKYDIKKIRKYAARVYQIDMEHQISPKSDIKVELTLRKIIKQLRPDIIYAHSSKAGAFARISDLGIRNKVIYNPHGWAFNTQPSAAKRKLYKWVEKISSYFSDKIVCVSDAEKRTALKNKICKPSKIKVIYSGIDLKRIRKVKPQKREKLNISNNAFVIGFVGRLTRLKSPDVFIKVAKKIKAQIPNAYFLMVGDGELRKEIKNLIHKYQLDSTFLMTGWVKEPISYIKIMNTGLLLSRWWEGFGLVLPEYMACKVPIVATNVGAISDIIDKRTGILVKENQYEQVIQAILFLYNNSKFKKELIRNSFKKVKKDFNEKRVIEETIQLYQEEVN